MDTPFPSYDYVASVNLHRFLARYPDTTPEVARAWIEQQHPGSSDLPIIQEALTALLLSRTPPDLN